MCTNLQYHPDRLGGDCSSEAESGVKKFLEVDAAWRVLSDQTTRTQYDLQRRGGTLNCASFTLFTDKVHDGFIFHWPRLAQKCENAYLLFTSSVVVWPKTQFSYVFVFCFFLKKCKTLILKLQTFFSSFRPDFPNSFIFFFNLNLNVQHECSILAKCYSLPNIINNVGLFTSNRVQWMHSPPKFALTSVLEQKRNLFQQAEYVWQILWME